MAAPHWINAEAANSAISGGHVKHHRSLFESDTTAAGDHSGTNATPICGVAAVGSLRMDHGVR